MLKKYLLLAFLCTFFGIAHAQQPLLTPSDSIVARAAEIAASGNTINKLDGSTPLKSPVGLQSAGSLYSISIDKMEITDKGGFLDASVAIPIPGSTKLLCFSGKRIPFSAKGGFSGIGRLTLVSEFSTPLLGGATLEVKKDGKTFVEFDCDGFKRMGLSADLLLDPNLITAADTIDGGKVRGHIETVVKDANDIMASVSLSPFKIKGVKDFVFTVSNASWDQSDMVNPSGFEFPATYSDPLYSSNPTLWRGFFFKNVTVKLPGYLNGNAAEPIIVKADNFLLDDTGVSGLFSATSVLSLEKGKIADGFAISVSAIAVEVTQNHLTKGSMGGFLRLPISQVDTLGYRAMADATGNFIFTAITKDTLQVNLWEARAKILPSSTVTIANNADGLKIEVVLNGNMTFAAPVGSQSNKLALTAPFEELFLSNKAPYFKVKAFGINDLNAGFKLAGLGFTLNGLSISCMSNSAKLSVDMNLSISGSSSSSSNAFSARGLVGIKAAKVNSKWGYDGVSLDEFALATEFSGFKLSGSLRVYNDSPEYGNGVSGKISLGLTKLDMTLEAAAVFGKVNGYNYWYADAYVTGLSIPVGTGLKIIGLGGGAYTKMRQGSPKNAKEDYGRASSGICYVPSKDISFGFMAKVGIASADGKLLQGDVALEMAFTPSGGISYISFLGHAKIMALGSPGGAADKMKEQAGKLADTVSDLGSSSPSAEGEVEATDLRAKAEAICAEIKKNDSGAPLAATMLAIFDFKNKSFFAKLEVFIDVYGVIKGVNAGGSAGEIVMYFAPSTWYIHAGTPTVPIGLELLGIAKITSYFMMGCDMPAFPPYPKEVSDILGLKTANKGQDMSSLAGGKGVAFGASFSIDTGNLQFLMFYASLKAGMGFDVMLKDFGTSQCAGADGVIGLNGWYAMGQAWGYVKGDVGIRVNLMFVKGNFNILSVAAAVILEAQLPNPTWLHGAVGGNYNILGGLVKGNCKFEFEIGDKCKVKSNAKDLLANMAVIAAVKPADGTSDISVFSKPQAVFNMPVGRAFAIDAPDGERYQFRARLDKFVTSNGATPIAGDLLYNADSTVVTLKMPAILPQKTSLTTTAIIFYEEFKKGAWQKVLDNGIPITEAKATSFTTGTAPDYIVPENVDIEYPVRGQKCFYRDEYGKGFVVLDLWQTNLFDNPKFKAVAHFKVGDAVVAKMAVTTNVNKNEINFDIPQALMATSTDYKLVLVNEPVDTNASNDKNVTIKETKVAENESSGADITLTTKEAKTDLVVVTGKDLYTVVFRTSAYKTFVEKVKTLTYKEVATLYSEISYVPRLVYSINESFDSVEKLGVLQTKNKPLISLAASFANNLWFTKNVEPLAYKGYPFLGEGQTARDTSIWGLYPYKAIELESNFDGILCKIPAIAKNDLHSVGSKLYSRYLKQDGLSNEQKVRLTSLVLNPVPDFRTKVEERLPLTISYVLPNGQITSKQVFWFKYVFND